MLASALATLTACNDEWKEEQYTQYVSFRAPLGKLGVTNVYVPYSRRNADKTFVEGSGLSSYQLPTFNSKGHIFQNRNMNIATCQVFYF